MLIALGLHCCSIARRPKTGYQAKNHQKLSPNNGPQLPLSNLRTDASQEKSNVCDRYLELADFQRIRCALRCRLGCDLFERRRLLLQRLLSLRGFVGDTKKWGTLSLLPNVRTEREAESLSNPAKITSARSSAAVAEDICAYGRRGAIYEVAQKQCCTRTRKQTVIRRGRGYEGR